MPRISNQVVHPSLEVNSREKLLTTQTKWMPIPRPINAGKSSGRPKLIRRTYNRVPSNDYVPRMCNNCGMSFVPGSEKLFGTEWCSGECRQSFLYRTHMERMLQGGKVR